MAAGDASSGSGMRAFSSTVADDGPSHEAGLRAILIARCLERIGDNAVDIGEQTAYLVTAEFREFTDASRTASV